MLSVNEDKIPRTDEGRLLQAVLLQYTRISDIDVTDPTVQSILSQIEAGDIDYTEEYRIALEDADGEIPWTAAIQELERVADAFDPFDAVGDYVRADLQSRIQEPGIIP